MAREARAEKLSERVAPPANAAARLAAGMAAKAGLDRKAEDVRVLDVRGLASYTDFLVLLSATSDRQANAIADAVDEALSTNGYRPIGVEGVGAGNWILVDAGDVVVHVFHQDARRFYDLDGLWADAKRVPVESEARAATAQLA